MKVPTIAVLLLALCSLALGTLGVAVAQAAQATGSIEEGAADCGTSVRHAVIGTASFSRSGNEVTVTYKLTHAPPEAFYEVTLWVDTTFQECLPITSLGFVGTNQQGQGSITGFDQVAPEDTRFFVTGQEFVGPFSAYNDSTSVLLP